MTRTDPASSSKTALLLASACGTSALYLVPALAQAAAVAGQGAPVGVDHNAATGALGQVFWDIDSDGNNDLVFFKQTGFNSYNSNSYSSGALNMDTYDGRAPSSLNGRGLVKPSGKGGKGTGDQMQNLGLGFQVGPTLSTYAWGDSQQTYRSMVNSAGTSLGGDLSAAGSWGAGGNQYFGFRFSRAGQTHYGWAEINLDLSGMPGGVFVTRWAWEDQPDTAITVGDVGAATAVPTLPLMALGLSILALGATGIRQMRQAKNNEQPPSA